MQTKKSVDGRELTKSMMSECGQPEMTEVSKKSGQRYNIYKMYIAWLEEVRKHKATVK